jgi:hypothetical protein
MNIKEVIATINQMEADGIFERYAIGGAIGATFYLEPVATLDVDVFVNFHTLTDTLIISPEPLFEYLKARGCVMEGEYVVVAGTPVQFLPTADGLGHEALEAAVQKDIDGIVARVMTAEHLAAIALQTGRAKDKTRLLQFIEESVLNLDVFQSIIERYGLAEKWQNFQRQYLSDSQ